MPLMDVMTDWQFVETRTITRRDRTAVAVDCWQRPCAKCNEPFNVLVPHGRTAATSKSFCAIHCPQHHLTAAEALARLRAGGAVYRREAAGRYLRWTLMIATLRRGVSERDARAAGEGEAIRRMPTALLTAERRRERRAASNRRYREAQNAAAEGLRV